MLFYFKRFPEKAQKRERATERKNPREQNTLSAREREQSALIASVITGTVPIGVDRDLAIDRNLADRDRDRDLTEKM